MPSGPRHSADRSDSHLINQFAGEAILLKHKVADCSSSSRVGRWRSYRLQQWDHVCVVTFTARGGRQTFCTLTSSCSGWRKCEELGVWLSADPPLLCRPLVPSSPLTRHNRISSLLAHIVSLLCLLLLQIEIRDTKDPRFAVQRFHWGTNSSSSIFSPTFLPPSLHPFWLLSSPLWSSSGSISTWPPEPELSRRPTHSARKFTILSFIKLWDYTHVS